MGIAGPTLAYWLLRAGHRPVIVESAPQLRRGGYIVDFWGLGYDIAEKMGLLATLKERAYFIEQVRIVDAKGRRAGGFSVDVFKQATNGRYMSLPRSELSAALFSAIPDIEVLWGNSIAAIEPGSSKVSVAFENTAPRPFDVVVGADGLHSIVRQLCFPGEGAAERYLGYQVAAFEVGGYPHRDENIYVGFNAPGRQIARFSMRNDKTLFLLIFHEPSLVRAKARACDARSQLREKFSGLGWETGEILSAMEQADEIYFDRVSQIDIPSWARGRVALAGDAAACPSLLAGEGSGLAMVAAYVLAGELGRTPLDAEGALERYERSLRPFVSAKQVSARRFANSFVPKSQFSIALRNLVTRLFVVPAIADVFMGSTLRDDFELPDFSWRM
jgi:2-polyprenyl-6-methoxyphenol hydroxylase-like FAD-dependent oxidoreductase